MTTTSVTVAEFPVPADLDGFWMFDQVHAPRPLTPLSAEILLAGLTEGFCSAMKEVGYPLGLVMRIVNSYGYIALVPHDGPDGEGAKQPDWDGGAEPATQGEPGWAALMERLGERWEHEWLPSILPGLERLRTLDYGALSDDDLIATLGALRQDLVARWRVHGYLLFTYQAASMFDDFYQETFHPSDPTEPYQLLSGFQTRTFDANRGIWQLSRTITKSPLLRRLFAETTASSLPLALEGYGAGRSLLTEQRARFDALYEQARYHVIVDENHNFYIDQIGNAALRLPVLELGRRLVGYGVVDRVDDVFLLTTAQIADGLREVDQRAQVARQRAALAHWSTVTPPPSIGEPPPDDELDPYILAMIKVDAPPEPQPQTPTEIRGTPASPGIARGRARVARSLEQASTIRPGQILVCEMTLPPWSVLFSTIRAVVADTGGILSHCATVAREYGIPCVVGTIVGTTAIQDDMLLEVNGSTGEVKILNGPA